MSDSIEDLLNEAYSTTHDMLRNPKFGSVVQDGLLISYSPPIPEPDLLLLTFQGGGADPEVQKTWPQKLLYLDSPHKFGTALRKLCRETGLYSTLESSTMAFPTVFPQAPNARDWESGPSPYEEWRNHSVYWVNRLVKAVKPKVVMVFGSSASKVFDIQWENVERIHKQNHPTFGTSTFHGAPAVYCHHLSQGYRKSEALKCFNYAKKLIEESRTRS